MSVIVRVFVRQSTPAVVRILSGLVVFGVFAGDPTTPIAAAAPRRVALLNVADDQDAGQAATRALRSALLADVMFGPLPAGDLARALEDPIARTAEDPEAEVLAAADHSLASAAEARAAFEDDRALAELRAAEQSLLAVRPTGAVVARLAEVNFQIGILAMGREESDRAIDGFRVVHRLDPGRGALDPARYMPPVLAAYQAAALPQKKSAKILVRTPYDRAEVLVDGQLVGTTPHEADLEAGVHYVWTEFPAYAPAGARIVAVADQTETVQLPLRPLPAAERIRQVRRELLGPAARRPPATDDIVAAAASVADIAGVPVVIVIVGVDPAALDAVVYSSQSGDVTTRAAWQADAAGAIVAALPGRLLPSGSGGGPPPPPPPPPPWYRTRWGIAAISGGVVLTLVGVAALAQDDTPPLSGTCCDFPDM
jgi:hypothetical protein